jgi:pyruvate dehydrogenase E2 component (dihydrolipoamide acetyltransferase)
LGVDLTLVAGSGRKGRITRDDVKAYVKATLTSAPAAEPAIPVVPTIDFSRFGEIEEVALSRIRRRSKDNLHRSWLNVPHVTQFDDADITDLEAYRRSQAEEAKERGTKLSILPFLMKAVVDALLEHPRLNSSLAPGGEALIFKKYFHLGIAVDTEEGLVVPVIRDVDQKGLFEIAEELAGVSSRAREGKLRMQDIQGSCFTISSLGGIGGTAFTPIVNAPEVAILGVSRSRWQPVYDGEKFSPRLSLPLSLSYDHRVVDGAEAVRFTTYLAGLLADVERFR